MKIICLEDHRKRKVVYKVDDDREWLTDRNVDDLVKKGQWMGTYTPRGPYGVQPGEDNEAGKHDEDP